MATLLDALSDCSFDSQVKRDLSGNFSKNLISYRDRVVSQYLKFNTDLSELISEIAKKENLNDDQIQRIVEEVNNQVYLIKYDKLKDQNEREVDFDIASVQKVKNKIKGTSEIKEKSEDVNKESEKVAFETDREYIEKIASSEGISGIFSGILEYTYGDLSTGNKIPKEEFLIKKIASKVKEEEKGIEKISSEINHSIRELAETFIHLERLGGDTNSVMSSLIKQANITQKGFEIIKEAITEKIATYVEEKYLPHTFEVTFDNLNLEKTASEKYSLGKYSFNKKAHECNIPLICLSTNKAIRSFSDIEKLANDLNKKIDVLEEKNNNYILMREKIATAGIEECLAEDFFLKEAGISDSINKLVNMVKSSNYVKNLNGANMNSAKKTMESAKASVNEFINSAPVKKQTETINNLNDKIKNINKNLSGSKTATNLNTAKENLDAIKKNNKDALRRHNDQGFIRNLFDFEARKAKNEMNMARNTLKDAQIQYNNVKNSKLNRYTSEKRNAENILNDLKKKNNFESKQKMFNETQDAYKKAMRNTYLTRGATIGVPVALGVGANKLNKKNDNSENEYKLSNMNFNTI